MTIVLEEKSLKEFINQEIPKSVALYAQNLVEWKKFVEKARWIVLEGVPYHIVLTLHHKETRYSIWKELMDLYQNNTHQKKLALKGKQRK